MEFSPEKLEKLEKLAKAATPGPWDVAYLRTNVKFVFAQAPNCDMVFHAREEDVKYITAACNTMPELVAELKAEREKVKELERQRDFFLKALHNNKLCPNGGCFHDGSDMDEWDCTSYDNSECWITAAKEAKC